MAHNAPAKHYRRGLTLAELFAKFPDDDTAEAWCAGPTGWAARTAAPTTCRTVRHSRLMRFRCRGCRSRFSTRTGKILADSNIGFRDWAVAIYLITTWEFSDR